MFITLKVSQNLVHCKGFLGTEIYVNVMKYQIIDKKINNTLRGLWSTRTFTKSYFSQRVSYPIILVPRTLPVPINFLYTANRQKKIINLYLFSFLTYFCIHHGIRK